MSSSKSQLRATDDDAAAARRVLSVLVVGTDDWAIEQAADAVTDAGHRVLRCHEPGQPAFPCNAMRPGGVCPLDVGFDVALTMRSRPVNPPVVDEFGAVCAIHAHRPLVIGGLRHDNPFEPWAAAVVNGDLGAAIEAAVPIDLAVHAQ